MLSIFPFSETMIIYLKFIILLRSLGKLYSDQSCFYSLKFLNYDFARNRRPSGEILENWKLTMCEGLEVNL